MRKPRRIMAIVLLLAVVAGGGYTGWRYVSWQGLQQYITSSYVMADFGGGFPGGRGASVEIPAAYELLHVVLVLADLDGTAGAAGSLGSAYHRQVMDWFREYGGHPAVEAVRASLGKFPAHRSIFGHELAADGSLRPDPAYQMDGLLQMGFRDGLGLLEDFAAVSDFHGFYERHQPYYEQQIVEYCAAVPLESMVSWLESNFPLSYESFRVVLSPLTGGTHNTWLFRDRNSREHQAVMFVPAPAGFAGFNLPAELMAGSITRTVFTELDHNYVNPTTDLPENQRLVVRAFSDRAKWYAGPVYDNPGLVFNEYMTWGVFTLWATEHYDADLAAQLAEQTAQIMLRRGFGRYREFQAELLAAWNGRSAGETAADMYRQVLRWAQVQ